MIQSLYIKNFALISSLVIQFDQGFSVITGETGAGKSILLGALSMLLGQRADAKSIRQGESKCIIEANFVLKNYSIVSFFNQNELDYDNGQCVIRREIQSNGKSRSFINDTPVSLNLLKELTSQLIDIHSQHRNLLVNDSQFQLHITDILAAHPESIADYLFCYQNCNQAQKEWKILLEQTQKNKDDLEYLTFQFKQLDESKLFIGEQNSLEQELASLEHTEEIKSALYTVNEFLSGEGDFNIISSLNNVFHTLDRIKKYLPQQMGIDQRIQSNLIDLEDITSDLYTLSEKIEFNPERLEQIRERLDLLYSLQKKHHVDDEVALIAKRDELAKKLDIIQSSDTLIADAEKKYKECEIKLENAAQKLSEERKKVIPIIEKKMVDTLKLLGMNNIQFKVDIKRKSPEADGIDAVSFLFSANKNTAIQPICEIASGGEIARVMLSLKALIAGAISLPTIIFDEIDTGVSGEIAGKMATIMQEMGRTMQVITITHLPQIASKGNRHYRVYKEDTEKETITHIQELTKEERIREIAGMLSNGALSKAAINNAKELLL